MTVHRPAVILLACLAASPVAAQVRTTQPPVINIFREFEKPGHFAAHEATEMRWTALNRTHNYPYSYLGLSAVSGPSEVWWVTGYDGLASFGKGSAWGGDNAAFSAGLAKIAAEDGEHLTSTSAMQAEAVPEASSGAYPDLSKMRVLAITTFSVRQGADFTPLAKQYAAVMKAKNVTTSFRVYRALAGAPEGTILVFASYPSWDALEAQEKASSQAMATMSPAEGEALGKLYRETVMNSNTRYFNINPRVSLVPKEYLADPFWGKP
ncbi:MAG TPA: hypothetical protein VF862_13670 [Gemmatimonadales bacterium]